MWADASGKVMAIMEQGQLPKGLKALMYLPTVDGRQADCLWETDRLDHLKKFIERETSQAAKNEYFQVNVDAAVGLPGQVAPGTHAESPVEEAMHMAM